MKQIKICIVISLLLLFTGILFSIMQRHAGDYRKESSPIPGDPIKIMPLGDSITAGHFTDDGGYRSRLQQRMIKAGFNFKFVGRNKEQSGDMNNPDHEGYPGSKISSIATAADEAVKLFHPDIILLFAGTCDLIDGLAGKTGNIAPDNPDYWGSAPERLDAMITHLNTLEPEVVIIVGTLLSFTEYWALAEPRAVVFNQKLSEIVEKQVRQGNKVFMADLRKAVPPEGLSDGVHPNQLGYEKMAEVWFQSLGKIIQSH